VFVTIISATQTKMMGIASSLIARANSGRVA
jgi:hypothetical protein